MALFPDVLFIALFRLDAARTKQHLELYPKRIILIRHAEVVVIYLNFYMLSWHLIVSWEH